MKIFINHSPTGGLKKLKGVGPKLAARIIQYREGDPFKDAEDLQDRVPGISAQLIRSWAKQRQLIITFEGDNEQRHGVREPEKIAEPPTSQRSLPGTEQKDRDDVFQVTISMPKRCCIVIAFCAVLIILVLIGMGSPMAEGNQSHMTPKKPAHPNKPKSPRRPIPGLPSNLSGNQTIYLQCIEDSDCGSGQRCFAGKLQPEERPFYLDHYEEEDFENGTFSVLSKFGLEELDYSLAGYMALRRLESGRRCWNIADEEGDDCGGSIYTICDDSANLACVYGKCTKTEDEWMLRGIRGRGFIPDKYPGAPCGSLGACFGPQLADCRSDFQREEYEYFLEMQREELKELNEFGNGTSLASTPPQWTSLNQDYTGYVFPKEFGVRIVMDPNLLKDTNKFPTREIAEKWYRTFMRNATSLYQREFGFGFRLQSICWLDHPSYWKNESKSWHSMDTITGGAGHFMRQTANTNIVVFVRYCPQKEQYLFLPHGATTGFARVGGIWFQNAPEKERHFGAASVHILSWSHLSLRRQYATLVHELGHAFGAIHTFELPSRLGGPLFPGDDKFICGATRGTIMSYCSQKSLEFDPNVYKFMHEYNHLREQILTSAEIELEFTNILFYRIKSKSQLVSLADTQHCDICEFVLNPTMESCQMGEAEDANATKEYFSVIPLDWSIWEPKVQTNESAEFSSRDNERSYGFIVGHFFVFVVIMSLWGIGQSLLEESNIMFINHVSLEMLTRELKMFKLIKVGEEMAQRIIDARPIRGWEDLQKVDGLTPWRIDLWRSCHNVAFHQPLMTRIGMRFHSRISSIVTSFNRWKIAMLSSLCITEKAQICLSKSPVKVLIRLPGAGSVIAKRIFAAQPFRSWYDLKRSVKGLKSETVDEWKADPYIKL